MLVQEMRGAPSTWGGILGAADVQAECPTPGRHLTERVVPLLREHTDTMVRQLLSNARLLQVEDVGGPLSAEHVWSALISEPSLGWLAQRLGFDVPTNPGVASAAAVPPPQVSDELKAARTAAGAALLPASKRRRVVASADALGQPPLPPLPPPGLPTEVDGRAVMWVRAPRPCIHTNLLDTDGGRGTVGRLHLTLLERE